MRRGEKVKENEVGEKREKVTHYCIENEIRAWREERECTPWTFIITYSAQSFNISTNEPSFI